ncbi:MAG: C25 family cysteine peptidase [Caldilineaceae bacterium]
MLSGEGYNVDLIPLSALPGANLKPYKLIIVADDTGYLENRGAAADQYKQIFDVAVPVLGIGEGGYAFFGQPGGMAIGWGNGWHGNQQEVNPVAGLSYYTNPHDLSALLGGPIKLYNEPVNEVAINLPEAQPYVTVMGWEPSDGKHASLVAEKLYENTLCYQLWGFSAGPRLMTPEGLRLFANAVRYGLNNCPPARQEPEVKAPELPIFNPKEQIRVEVLQADNTVFAAEVALPAAQLWPVKAEDGNTYMELALPGVDMDGNTPGLPGVPVIHRIIAIPEGAEVILSDVEVRASQYMTDVIIYPSQPEPVDGALNQGIPGDDKPNPEDFKDKPFTIDEKAYSSGDNFPAQVVSVQPLGKMRDLNLVQVNIAAGQYNPAKRTLKLFDKVQLAIKFDGGEGGFLPREMMDNPFDDQAKPLYQLALNYEVISKYPFPGSIVNRICWGHEYLIITDPAFRAAADTLRTWKIQKGISTLVMETGNDSGDAGSTKEQIQQTIRNKFNNCIIRPSYVLLLGDAEHIAPFYRTTSSGGANSGTDLDYALMDNTDIMPDLALGRIPVDTLDEANTVINKIVGYEKTPPFAPGFYNSMSFAAYFQCCRNDVADDGRTVRSFIETAELVRGQVSSLGYNVERIYTTDTGYEGDYAAAGRDATPRKYRNGAALPAALGPGSGFAWDGDNNDVINAFNEGRFLIFHRDHGWSGGWGDPGFTTANIDSLTNGAKLPVVYSVNCASGFFDNETSGGNVNGLYWAEKLLRKEGGGSVGIIGDTRNSPTWANSALSRGLFDATWPNVVPEGGATSIRRLGDILNYGKSYLAGQVGVAQTAGSVGQTSANDDIVLYHVYGDPTMQMWTSNPWHIKLPRLYEIVKFDPTIWELRYPIEGAVITLLQEGNPVARATVRNGVARMPILLDGFEADKGFDLSAAVPGGLSTLLESGRSSGNVTPEQGGSLQDELGRIKLQFPAGAVQEPTTILLTDVADDNAGDDKQLRRFVLEGVDEDGEVVDTFDTAYSMELHYTDEELAAAGLDESSLQCSWRDEATGEWQPVESTVDPVNNIVTCQVDHFTEFALRGETTAVEQPVMDNFIFLPVVVR